MTRRRRRPPPPVPRPGLARVPSGPYGWLDVRLLTDHHLRDLDPEAVSVLVFLALTADRRGASWWGRTKMARELGLSLGTVDQALDQLRAAKLLAHRPWKRGDRDGVWQLLPLPDLGDSGSASHSGPTALGDVLRAAHDHTTDPPNTPPESRAS